MSVLAWHFLCEDRRLGYDDGNVVEAGCVYEVPGPVALCKWGLHASREPLAALLYAPGPVACRVELSGEVVHDSEKSVATRRKVIWMVDATKVLHEFACQVAEQALRTVVNDDKRCWEGINAKRKWLTGEITYTDLASARDAARDAADRPWRRPRDGIWGAAWTGARYAAQYAAWNASYPDPRKAARDGAFEAAKCIAFNTGYYVAESDHSRPRAAKSAHDIAWATERERQNTLIAQMLGDAKK